MVGQDFGDRALGAGHDHRILVLVVRETDQTDGECPASPSRPSRIIDGDRRPKGIPRLGRQEVPSDDQIASGISDAEASEVDDRTDLAVVGE